MARHSAAAVLALALLAHGAPQAAAQGPVLRDNATVHSDLVRIGDLVENAGAAATVPVFRAPDLGQTGTVQADRIVEALRPHGLGIVDTRGLAEVAVARASRIVTVAELESRIAAAIAAHTGSLRAADLAVVFDRRVDPLHVETAVTAAPQVLRLSFDPRSGRFDAAIDIPGSAAARRANLRVTGTATESVEAIVVMRPVGRGEMLRASDVVIERRPRADLGTDGFVAPDSAVGMAARRQLRAGQVLRAADLMKPEIVGRNDNVTIVFEIPGISVTTRGRAMTAGAEGDTVTVTNIQTKKVLQGVVVGPGRVAVSPVAGGTAVALADPAPTASIRPTAVRTQSIRPAEPAAAPPQGAIAPASPTARP